MTSVIKPMLNDFTEISQCILPYNVLAENYGDALAAEQLMLEHESYTLGEARFFKTLERQIERGEVCDNAVAKPLLDVLIPALYARIEEDKNTGGRGKPPVWRTLLKQCPSESMAVITIKSILMVLAKEESADLQRVASTISNNIEDEVQYGRIRDEEAKHFKQRVKPNLDKRNGLLFKKAYMQAVESGMLSNGELETTWNPWDKMDKMNLGIRLIEMVIEATNLVVLKRAHAGATAQELVSLSPEYVEKLTTRSHALAGISPMHQPMIVPPKKWTGIKGGGYWAKGRRPLNLIRVGSKRALMRYMDVDMPQVYDSINAIQETAWQVNKGVLAVVNQVVNWDACPVSDIPSLLKADKPEMEEGIVCPDSGSILDEVRLKKWKKAAAAIYRKEKARQSRRLSLEFILEQANKFSKYSAIYFPHNMDWRSRVYAIPLFNPQGNEVTKGLLTFAERVPLGSKGAYWLAVHGANCAGVDKVSLDERVQWIHDNEANILEVAEAPLDNTWWSQRDSPFCFLAFCFEWAAYCKSGKSENFKSNLPLAFDGTCSGLQHFSAMLRDEVGGSAVNLTPSEKPQDIYGIVSDKVNVMLKDMLENGTEDSYETKVDKASGAITERLVFGTKRLARVWLEYGVTRSVTKRSVMTLAYGSKEYGFADQVLEDTIQPAMDNDKGAMFGDLKDASQYARGMAKLIWTAVKTTVIAAVETMEWLQASAKLVSTVVKEKKTGEILKPAMPVTWTTPAGFTVWSEYTKQDQKRIDLIFMGQQRIRVTVNTGDKTSKDGRPEIDAAKQASGIAPNFIHSQDASHLQLTVNACAKQGVKAFAMIHDSFGCHAGFAHIMFEQVRQVLVDTYENHDVIQEFYEEFSDQLHESQLDKMPEIPAKGSLDIREILKSLYTFS